MAAPNPQMTNFPTPTPGSDGRIIYVVQEGDTLWRIAAVAGINVADLRDLNFLDSDDIVFVGMQLFLGLGGPSGDQPTQLRLLRPLWLNPPSLPSPAMALCASCSLRI